MRDLFFSSLNLPKDAFYYKNETYRVLTGHGVLRKR
jgi:hypothetical protein